ncbi:hypothetical protein GCM10022254_63080 [Actinomadura meridiana]|uniref:Uncharacterized protein n=1 Tax=Actinomadura meridiana TaxID=559626 RepID=A0ABP8CJ61_9ACTN
MLPDRRTFPSRTFRGPGTVLASIGAKGCARVRALLGQGDRGVGMLGAGIRSASAVRADTHANDYAVEPGLRRKART